MMETFESTMYGGTVTLKYFRLLFICPFTKNIDLSHVKITYSPRGKLIEVGSLLQYLKAFARVEITHEALACQIEEDIKNVLGVGANVTVHLAETDISDEVVMSVERVSV